MPSKTTILQYLVSVELTDNGQCDPLIIENGIALGIKKIVDEGQLTANDDESTIIHTVTTCLQRKVAEKEMDVKNGEQQLDQKPLAAELLGHWRYKREFAEFPDLPFNPASYGFVIDTSWHHNACPSFETADNAFCLWINWPDITERFYHLSSAFSLYRNGKNGLENEFVFSTNSLTEIKAYLAELQERQYEISDTSMLKQGGMSLFDTNPDYSENDIDSIASLSIGDSCLIKTSTTSLSISRLA